MVTENVEYRSADGISSIDARLWMPDTCEPKAVIQIVHGMSEHIGRYADFAGFLTDNGFVVCAESHIGHGKTASTQEDLGYMPPDGKDVLLTDVHLLRTAVSEAFPELPYFIFGHSMGSFITRIYISRYGEGLMGAVLCGTGNQSKLVSLVGRALALAMCRIRGPRFRSRLLDSMGAGAFGRRIENARTPVDWLSYDPYVIDAYLADEMCGKMFTVSAYATLLDLTAEAASMECALRMPPELPLLFIAGADDPVGDFGKGVYAAADLVEDAGVKDVEVILYEGMRHEILNGDDRGIVYDDVLEWLDEVLRQS